MVKLEYFLQFPLLRPPVLRYLSAKYGLSYREAQPNSNPSVVAIEVGQIVGQVAILGAGFGIREESVENSNQSML